MFVLNTLETTMISMVTGKWITSPGDLVQDAISDEILRRNEVRDALGLGEVAFTSFLAGETELTARLAQQLAKVVGGSAVFWQNLESQYRKEREEDAESVSWLPSRVTRIPRVYKGISRYAYC